MQTYCSDRKCWLSLGERVFLVSSDIKTAFGAEKQCSLLHGHLAVLGEKDAEDAFKNFFSQRASGLKIFAGFFC